MSGGLYVFQFNPTGVEEERVISRASSDRVELQLKNPSREFLNVRFLLPKSEKVSVELYDITGRNMGVFPFGIRNAGWHETRIPISLISGVYFVRLIAGEESAISKVVVLR